MDFHFEAELWVSLSLTPPIHHPQVPVWEGVRRPELCHRLLPEGEEGESWSLQANRGVLRPAALNSYSWNLEPGIMAAQHTVVATTCSNCCRSLSPQIKALGRCWQYLMMLTIVVCVFVSFPVLSRRDGHDLHPGFLLPGGWGPKRLLDCGHFYSVFWGDATLYTSPPPYGDRKSVV